MIKRSELRKLFAEAADEIRSLSPVVNPEATYGDGIEDAAAVIERLKSDILVADTPIFRLRWNLK